MAAINKLLAAGASAALLVGCGNERNPEVMVVPQGSKDRGINLVEVRAQEYIGRSFLVKSRLLGKVSCGIAAEEDNEGNETKKTLGKKITQLEDDLSQVDCYIDPGPNISFDDLRRIKELEVKSVSAIQE